MGPAMKITITRCEGGPMDGHSGRKTTVPLSSQICFRTVEHHSVVLTQGFLATLGSWYGHIRLWSTRCKQWYVQKLLWHIPNYNMVRWISAPGTMHFCPQYDTFWPCGLLTLLQFCKHPPSKISMKLRWVSSVNLVNCGDIFNLLTILSSPEINDSF